MNPETQKINLKEKIAYGFGDFASSMFWKLFSIFLLFFYTDVFGISAAAVGTMFLMVRIWDALNDPMMGVIADRTTSRWGKFRPLLLYGAVPFAIIGILTFTTPGLSATGKLIYAYVTYTLMMMVYTFVNVPYGALMAVMSRSSEERTSLASWRFIGAFSGGLFVTASASSLVEYFSKETDQATGFQLTIAIYSVLAAVLFVLTFLWTRERLSPPKEIRSRLIDDLKDLVKNGPWFIMLGANISILIFTTLREGSLLYYFKYFVKEQPFTLFGQTYQLSDTVLSSLYLSIWLAANIVGVILAKPIAAKLGKKNTFSWAALISAFLSAVFFFIQADQIVMIFGLNVLMGISAGIILPIGWSIYADIADYSEWKTGRRATGLVFSSSSMSQKFGWTIGGAFSGWLLAAFGYEANVEQSEQALLGIRLMVSVIAAAGALGSFAFMRFYMLDESYMKKVKSELDSSLG